MGSHFELNSGEPYSKPAGRPLWFYIVIAIVVGVLAFVIGILIGRYAVCDDQSSSTSAPWSRDEDPEMSSLLIDAIDNKRIEENLRKLTEKPHIAGEQADFDLVDFLKQAFKDYGLDSVASAPYDVLLSYPEGGSNNHVQLLDNNGDVQFDSLDAESNITYEEGVIPPFLAYSPSKEIIANLTYVNYGRVEDYDTLYNMTGINVTGKIVIVRYGKIFRGSKVDIASRHGAVGVILYSDPQDYTSPNDSRVYPDTVWLPPTAAQRGTIYTGDGDPLTPGYPAIATAYRYPEDDPKVALPSIPAHPIGYGAAKHFLERLGGDEVPEGWRGGLNMTYRFGPLSSGDQVRMNITTTISVRRAENIIAIIKGEVEPDRYVLLGNHRDAWVYGSIDPSSGTAVMMEVARVLGDMVKQGKWRPRRSIMFCSWGAEEYGLIGSTEWAEQYVKSLGPRAVAYLNIDIAVQGNYSLRALGTPLLHRSTYEATKKVSNPNPEEVSQGRTTVYDTWKHSFPTDNKELPRVGALGSGSDYAPMLQIIGITSVDFRYTYDSNTYKLGSYPLYHTEYETFDAVKNLLDQNFEYHQAVGRVGVEMLRSLSDSLLLPFNLSDYARGLDLNRQQLHQDYGHLLESHVDNYANLTWVIGEFKKDVETFETIVRNIDKKDPMAVRMVNDQMVMLEKAFLDPAGLPTRPAKKHLLFAENSNDAYAGSSFPGLVDLLFEIDELPSSQQDERWEQVRHHFSVIIHVIQAAGFTLRDVTNFVEEKYD